MGLAVDRARQIFLLLNLSALRSGDFFRLRSSHNRWKRYKMFSSNNEQCLAKARVYEFTISLLATADIGSGPLLLDQNVDYKYNCPSYTQMSHRDDMPLIYPILTSLVLSNCASKMKESDGIAVWVCYPGFKVSVPF